MEYNKRTIMYYDERLKRWAYDDDPVAAVNHRFRDHRTASARRTGQECIICSEQPTKPHKPSIACQPLKQYYLPYPKSRHSVPDIRSDVPQYPTQLSRYISTPYDSQVNALGHVNVNAASNQPQVSAKPTQDENAEAGPSNLSDPKPLPDLPRPPIPEIYDSDSSEDSTGSRKGKERVKTVHIVPNTPPQELLNNKTTKIRKTLSPPPPLSKIPQCRMPIHPNGMPCPLGEWHAPPGRPRPKSPPMGRKVYVRPSATLESKQGPNAPPPAYYSGIHSNKRESPASTAAVDRQACSSGESSAALPLSLSPVGSIPRMMGDSFSSSASLSVNTPVRITQLSTSAQRVDPNVGSFENRSAMGLDTLASPDTPIFGPEMSTSPPTSPTSSLPPKTPPSATTSTLPPPQITALLHVANPDSVRPVSTQTQNTSIYDAEMEDAMILEFERVSVTSPQVLLLPPTLPHAGEDLDRYAATKLGVVSPNIPRFALSDPGMGQPSFSGRPKPNSSTPVVKAKIFKYTRR